MRTTHVAAVAITLTGALLAACGKSGEAQPQQQVSVAQCLEPFKVVSCGAFDGHGNGDCIFENVAAMQLSGYPYAWGYDVDGVKVGKLPLMEVNGLMPNKKVQQHVFFNTTSLHKVVICSLDPESAEVNGTISPI